MLYALVDAKGKLNYARVVLTLRLTSLQRRLLLATSYNMLPLSPCFNSHHYKHCRVHKPKILPFFSVVKKPGGPNSDDPAVEAEEDANPTEDADDILEPENPQVRMFLLFLCCFQCLTLFPLLILYQLKLDCSHIL